MARLHEYQGKAILAANGFKISRAETVRLIDRPPTEFPARADRPVARKDRDRICAARDTREQSAREPVTDDHSPQRAISRHNYPHDH
jgi:hypothetical protein